jgi:hypothetical protein
VAGPTTLSTVDLQRLLDVVDPACCDGPGRFVPQTFLTGLADLVGADDVTFQVLDPYERTIALQSIDPGDADDAGSDISDLWWRPSGSPAATPSGPGTSARCGALGIGCRGCTPARTGTRSRRQPAWTEAST